jgi:hypothetical protein
MCVCGGWIHFGCGLTVLMEPMVCSTTTDDSA